MFEKIRIQFDKSKYVQLKRHPFGLASFFITWGFLFLCYYLFFFVFIKNPGDVLTFFRRISLIFLILLLVLFISKWIMIQYYVGQGNLVIRSIFSISRKPHIDSRSLKVSQNIWQRVWKYGTITIGTDDGPSQTKLDGIKNPLDIPRQLEELERKLQQEEQVSVGVIDDQDKENQEGINTRGNMGDTANASKDELIEAENLSSGHDDRSNNPYLEENKPNQDNNFGNMNQVTSPDAKVTTEESSVIGFSEKEDGVTNPYDISDNGMETDKILGESRDRDIYRDTERDLGTVANSTVELTDKYPDTGTGKDSVANKDAIKDSAQYDDDEFWGNRNRLCPLDALWILHGVRQ